MNKAIFLDRDGAINELVYGKEYGTVDSPMVPAQVKLVYGISELIKSAKNLGFKIIDKYKHTYLLLQRSSYHLLSENTSIHQFLRKPE